MASLLEITIQRRGKDGVWPVVAHRHRPGTLFPVRSDGGLELAEEPCGALPHAYGTALGEALFRAAIRDAFIGVLSGAPDGTARVLLFLEAEELRTWRWEWLCGPLDGIRWAFLSLEQRVLFSLYLPSLTDRAYPPIGRHDLRALVVVASPADPDKRYGLAAFDVSQNVARLRAIFESQQVPSEVLARVPGAVGSPTLDQVVCRLTDGDYTVLHLVCHGRFNAESGETTLFLEQPDPDPGDGEVLAHPVTATELIARLAHVRRLPYLVFLSVCDSGAPEAEPRPGGLASPRLGGLAQRLVRELGIPAVIGMTERVTIATADALAEAFYRRLLEQGKTGEVDRALVEAYAGLAARPDVNVPALYNRLAGQPLFSAALDRDLTRTELRTGLQDLGRLVEERAPVLQPRLTAAVQKLEPWLEVDAAALSVTARQEREAALQDVNELCQETVELSFHALAQGGSPPGYDIRCPFRGLSAFQSEDREFFFGREALVNKLQHKLSVDPFLPVLGPSGSGKSSLVLAGLIPALQVKDGDWACMRPGSDPLGTLNATIDKIDSNSVLVVDQFEELFTLCKDERQHRAFIDQLLKLADEGQRVVLTLRSDFWGECAPYADLKERMQTRQELVAPMNKAELRAAMEQQAAKVGLRFEADLSNTMLDEVAGEPGAMPLLQHALLELWKRRHGRWLLASEYRALGGVKQAITQTADRLYKDLPKADQERVRDIFVRLTHLGEDVVASEERRDTRRRVSLVELVPADSEPGATKALVKRLADAVLVVTSRNAVTEKGEVEVAHEALIRHWGRLHEWLDENLMNLRLRDSISEAAKEWEHKLQDESLLIHRGSRLHAAETLLNNSRFPLTEKERRYVKACTDFSSWERERWKNLYEDAERQRKKLKLLNLELGNSLANNNFVQGIGLLGDDRGDKATARFVQALRLDPSHSSASAALFSLLTRRWHPQKRWRIEHPDAVYEAAFTPDGTKVISRGEKVVYIWNACDLTTPPIRLEHGEHVMSMHVSKKADVLLTTSTTWGGPDQLAEGTTQLWDIRTGRSLGSCGVKGAVYDAIFGPREERIFVSSAFGPVALTAKLERASEEWPDAIEKGRHCIQNAPSRIALHEGSNRLFWTGGTRPDGRAPMLYTWDTTTWKLIDKREEEFNLIAFEIASDGRSAAFACPDPPSVRGIGEHEFGYACVLIPKTAKVRPFRVDHGETITCLQFHGAGRTAVTASLDHTARLWRVRNGNVVSVLQHPSGVTAAAFSPDGRLLVTGTRDGAVRIWDALKGRALSESTWQEGEIASIRFDPSGSQFLTASSSGYVRCYGTGSTTFGQLVLETGQPRMRAASFLSDESPLVVVRSEDRIEIWDCLAARQICEFLIGNKTARIADTSSDGKLLAMIDGRSTEVREIVSGKARVSLRHRTDISHVEFSGSENDLITVSNHEIRVSSLNGQDRQITTHEHEVCRTAHLLSGNRLLTASTEAIRLWSLHDGTLVEEFRHNEEKEISTLTLRGLCRERERLEIVDVTAREDVNRMLVLYGHEGACVEQPRYKNRFTVEDAQLWMINPLRPSSPRLGLGKEYGLNGAVFNPAGDFVVTTSNKGDVRVWTSKTGEAIHGLIKHPFPVFWVAFGPCGDTAAVYGKSDEVHLWSLMTGQRIGRVLTHDSTINQVRFAPDSNVLIVWTEDGTIRLWDSETGMQLGDDIPAVYPPIHSVDVGMGGDVLITVAGPGVASIWRIGARQLFRKSLANLLALAESDCGWRISKQGFEDRHPKPTLVGEKDLASGTSDSDWLEFYTWFRTPPEKRTIFPGTPVSAHTMYESLLAPATGPNLCPILCSDSSRPMQKR